MNRTESVIKILDAQGAYCGQCSREPGDSLNACRDCAAVLETYANALEEAGLLMPELPEPDVVKLNGDVKYLICDAAQVRQDAESGRVQVYSKYLLTTIEARRLALALLAACEYAEKEQGNE